MTTCNNLAAKKITILIVSIFISLCISMMVYLFFIQTPLLSKREISPNHTNFYFRCSLFLYPPEQIHISSITHISPEKKDHFGSSLHTFWDFYRSYN